MSDLLRSMFRIHAVVAFLFGVPLLLSPGFFLTAIEWTPVDPILSRVIGAALIALAWTSLRGSQAPTKERVVVLIEMNGIFSILGAIGVMRHMLSAYYPEIVFVLFGILVFFAIGWITFWLT